MVNTNKIKGRMRELGLVQADVAKYLEISQSSLSQKINNIRPFDLLEAEKLAECLKIGANELGIYFFNHKVVLCNNRDIAASDSAEINSLQPEALTAQFDKED